MRFAQRACRSRCARGSELKSWSGFKLPRWWPVGLSTDRGHELVSRLYVSIFNCAGFLPQIEVDWTAQIIAQVKKPVMAIKPLAAGQLRPFQGLTFAWNALRDIDMVTVGTMSVGEAREAVERSLEILERRSGGTRLQETRSKQSVKRVLVR